MQPIVKGYVGPMEAEGVTKAVEMKLNLSDEQLSAVVSKFGKKTGTGLSLKRYPVPFLESKLQSIAWLPDSIQRLLLEIHTQLAILDAEAENVQHYFRMTFDTGITADNRERVLGNLEQGYKNYGAVAKYIATRVAQIEEAWRE